MCNEKVDIRSKNYKELEEYLVGELKEPKFRAKQLYEWMHVHLALNYDEMKNIPNSLKDKLRENCEYRELELIDLQVFKIDGTRKYLFELEDGAFVESVLMVFDYGFSACLSSQVGCNMACSFCSSGILGKQRNLEPEEMVGQVLVINQLQSTCHQQSCNSCQLLHRYAP